MRLIDADELLTAFPVDDEPTLTKSCVRMTIQHMPTVEPHPKQRWIPVSERLPDSAKPVLVVNEDGKYAIAFYHYIDKMWGYEWRLMYDPYDDDVWENNEHGVIVAWMPLPEPYKGEEE